MRIAELKSHTMYSSSSESSQDEQKDVEFERPLEFYKDNEKTPYYWKGKEEFQMEEVLNILQLNVDGDRICSERPLSVAENAAFVVDTRELPTRKDYLEDNIGNFRNLGHCGKVFKVGNNKIVKRRCMERTVKERLPLERDEFLVKVVKDTKMRKCYGCGAAVRQNISFEPPSPWNIVLYRREYRIYTPRGKDSLQIATKKENVYYHPRKKCLLEKNSNVSGNAIEVSEALKGGLTIFTEPS
ncbi:hypothetical protein OS493_007119 [Desmophyllum pertusum]|uniref:Uncharacterized protein n=1 Tax=Desmophyllum pertusum TaxID=174260 RepID=A0A9W9ZFI8_9CNID|nr:hypothetical protein OS493_007119 [Desmophyllum pertusum]